MKKFKKHILTVLMLLFAVFFIKTNAFAYGNITDQSFEFYFPEDDWSYLGHFTQERDKDDDTYAYMKCYSCEDNSYSASAWAVNPDGSNDSDHYPGLNADSDDPINGPNYTFWDGSTRYMTNYIYEHGYRRATINASANSGYNFTANGVWSPDSV